MKIISNGECYVQGYDLERMLIEDRNLSPESYSKIASKGTNKKELSAYYKVENDKLAAYIEANDEILDFNELSSKNFLSLYEMVANIRKEIIDLSYDSIGTDSKSLIANYRAKLRREQYIAQIKEVIAFKRLLEELKRVKGIEYTICIDEESSSLVLKLK